MQAMLQGCLDLWAKNLETEKDLEHFSTLLGSTNRAPKIRELQGKLAPEAACLLGEEPNQLDLFCAIRNGQHTLVKWILDCDGELLNYCHLCLAVREKNCEMVRMLLGYNDQLEVVGRSALSYAIENGDLQMTKMLCEEFGFVLVSGDIDQVVMSCNVEVLYYLFDWFEELKHEHLVRILALAIYNDKQGLFKCLVYDNMYQDYKVHDMTLLQWAVYLGKKWAVQYMIQKNFDLDNELVLLKAVELDHVEIAEMLIANGAIVGMCDSHGQTVLHMARSEEMMVMLMKEAVNQDWMDNDKFSPLMVQVEHANFGLVNMLSKTASSEDLAWSLVIAIHYFFKDPNGYLDIMKCLMSHGANPFYQFEDHSPYDYLSNQIEDIIAGSESENVKHAKLALYRMAEEVFLYIDHSLPDLGRILIHNWM